MKLPSASRLFFLVLGLAGRNLNAKLTIQVIEKGQKRWSKKEREMRRRLRRVISHWIASPPLPPGDPGIRQQIKRRTRDSYTALPSPFFFSGGHGAAPNSRDTYQGTKNYPVDLAVGRVRKLKIRCSRGARGAGTATRQKEAPPLSIPQPSHASPFFQQTCLILKLPMQQ